jgi:hypothetical protein
MQGLGRNIRNYVIACIWFFPSIWQNFGTQIAHIFDRNFRKKWLRIPLFVCESLFVSFERAPISSDQIKKIDQTIPIPWKRNFPDPPRSSARDFESRVSTISPSRHLESESYSMNMISI